MNDAYVELSARFERLLEEVALVGGPLEPYVQALEEMEYKLHSYLEAAQEDAARARCKSTPTVKL